jgi:8-amino-7-oxononanoate synthase
MTLASPRRSSPRRADRSHAAWRRLSAIGDLAGSVFRDGYDPFTLVIDRLESATEALLEGRRTLIFGTSDYLGLSQEPTCLSAMQEAGARYGIGSTAARVSGGNYSLIAELERTLGEQLGMPYCHVISTGYMANIGAICGLCEAGDALVVDRHCHASIIDGARQSGAEIAFFDHNDLASLEAALTRAATAHQAITVIVESVYSVWGDRPDLAATAALARRFGALLVVDEAHAYGVFGYGGAGAAADEGVSGEVDILTGTFSKSAGQIGGFAASAHPAFRHFILKARPYIFSAALPPTIAAGIGQAVAIIRNDHQRRERLWDNIRRMHAGLQKAGFDVAAPPGPVISIRMERLRHVYGHWCELLRRGVYVVPIVPPGTPDSRVVLRCSVASEHTPGQIDEALAKIADVLT